MREALIQGASAFSRRFLNTGKGWYVDIPSSSYEVIGADGEPVLFSSTAPFKTYEEAERALIAAKLKGFVL